MGIMRNASLKLGSMSGISSPAGKATSAPEKGHLDGIRSSRPEASASRVRLRQAGGGELKKNSEPSCKSQSESWR
eukprot:140852-Amorphochlora_amoeboformis.AAC.1